MRWHISQVTPSKSSPCISDAFGGSLRSSSQPFGKWQRSQTSAAFGVPTAQIESCAATVMAAQNKGSRAACPIIEPFQGNIASRLGS
jgi:hypothetical protein